MIRIFIILVLVLALAFVLYHYLWIKPCSKLPNPGVGERCRCDQVGDDNSKFYGDDWRARGAVCDGLYIPREFQFTDYNAKQILSKMQELVEKDNGLKNNMVDLVRMAEAKLVLEGRG